MKARTLGVARGEYRVADEPRVWFTSTESFAKVLSAGNRELLRIISEAEPRSIEELAQLTGRAKSNLCCGVSGNRTVAELICIPPMGGASSRRSVDSLEDC